MVSSAELWASSSLAWPLAISVLPLLTFFFSLSSPLPSSSPAGPRAQKARWSLPWGMRMLWENTPAPLTTALARQGPPQ